MDYRWRVLMAVGFGTFMATMDFSIVGMALPYLAEEFDRSPDTVVWVSLISSLVVTGLTLTAGRAGDLFGRKRVYVMGWAIFTVGMALAPAAPGIGYLIAARFFQSIGLSLAIANGNALVTSAFPADQRGRALGLVGALVGAGLMSGPIFGGAILAILDWRAIFYLRIPIGIIASILALAWIRESEVNRASQRRLDVPGALALFLTLATALLAVNRGASWGWTSPAILSLFLVAAVGLATFLRVEARSASPVLSLALFRVRSFAISILSLVLNFTGQAAVTFLMPFYLTDVRGYGPGQAGAIIATVPLMMLILSPVSGYVSDRYGPRYQTALGLVLVAAGLVLLGTLGETTPVPLVMARLALIGVGAAIFGSPNVAMIMSSVPPANLSTASASTASARNIGNALGLALASAVMVGVATASAGVGSGASIDDLAGGALLDGIQAAFFAAAAFSALAAVASLLRPERAAGPVAAQPASQRR